MKVQRYNALRLTDPCTARYGGYGGATAARNQARDTKQREEKNALASTFVVPSVVARERREESSVQNDAIPLLAVVSALRVALDR